MKDKTTIANSKDKVLTLLFNFYRFLANPSSILVVKFSDKIFSSKCQIKLPLSIYCRGDLYLLSSFIVERKSFNFHPFLTKPNSGFFATQKGSLVLKLFSIFWMETSGLLLFFSLNLALHINNDISGWVIEK